jgi:hypothetical protein
VSSFNIVNYSLRPSKHVQRQLVFDGLQRLSTSIPLDDRVYIGFGSIWFTDFVHAHKALGIERLVSIEHDAIGFSRASFNKPFSTVDVIKGDSSTVLKGMFAEGSEYIDSQWIMWLDYDGHFSEDVAADLRLVVERAPSNSVVIITFNAVGKRYGKPIERPKVLQQIFGSAAPATLAVADCTESKFPSTIASVAMRFMQTTAHDAGRIGGFVPAFRISYSDSANMVTVGGVLPTAASRTAVTELVKAADWPGFVDQPISIPHLTAREAIALQACLPCTPPLSRASVQSMGFDLEESQLDAFVRYYKQYPSFAQVVL